MEKTKARDNEQSKLRAFLTGDTFKALLPLIGFAVIIIFGVPAMASGGGFLYAQF